MAVSNIKSHIGYFVLAFVIYGIEQTATFYVRVSQPLQILLLVAAMLLISLTTLYIAKRTRLVESFKNIMGKRNWELIGLGLLFLYVVKYVGALVLQEEGATSTANQSGIENLGMNPIILIVATTILAPIVEEVVFRGLLMGRVFDRNSYFGLALSSFLFGLAHFPTNIGSWIIYGGMGVVLGLLYRRTGKLEHTMMVHCLNNAVGTAIMLLLQLLLHYVQ
ncbi:CPBP family intramembrane glutamic endopeptidase [Streptococcus dentiloxodontae]